MNNHTNTPLSFAAALAMASGLQTPAPRADIEHLLMAVTGYERVYFYTWPDRLLTPEQAAHFLQLLERRRQGEPVAYLTGQRGFRGLDLRVSSATLIPRPDTELLVEIALGLLPEPDAVRCLDLGTGSGAIALALAQDRPCWEVVATDRSPDALAVARENARLHGLDHVSFVRSDWLADCVGTYDLIVSNPPYIAEQDPHLTQGDLRFEPLSALASGPDGLADLRVIVAGAPRFLAHGGWIVLEHGYDQEAAVRELLCAAQFSSVSNHRDYGGQPRVTVGQWLGTSSSPGGSQS